MSKKFELIMELKDIPNYSVVKKLQGAKLYKVFDSIVVFTKTPDVESQKIIAKNGCKFLVDAEGNYGINAYPGDAKFIVTELTVEDLYRILDTEDEGP